MTGVTGFTGSVGFTSAVTDGVGVAGVTVQSALKLAPLGVVVQVVVGAGGTGAGVGAGAICCPATIPDLVSRLCSAVPHTAFTPCCTSWLVIGAGVGVTGGATLSIVCFLASTALTPLFRSAMNCSLVVAIV